MSGRRRDHRRLQPLADPSLRARRGAVTSLGPGSIGGRAVHNYLVVMSASAIAKLQRSAGVTSPDVAAAKSLFGESGMRMTVAVDDATGQLGRLSMTISSNALGASSAVSVVETLTDYGEPVHITAPPASEVGSLGASGARPPRTTTGRRSRTSSTR